jgi:cytochrome c-type biogenesis protein CcmH/NrfG
MPRANPPRVEGRVIQLRQLLDKDPADEAGWYGLGRALLDLGRPDEAVEPLRRAVALKIDYTAAYRDLGRALLESDRHVEAAEVFARAVCLAEKTGDIQTGREIHVFLRRAESQVREG